MRTTLDLNEALLREAKKRAVEEGKPLRAVVEDALRLLVQARASERLDYRLRWGTESGRLQPGVRLDDRQALFDLMEGRD